MYIEVKPDMPNALYHSLNRINASSLKTIFDAPEKWKYEQDNPPAATPALLIGSAAHTLVLEPEKFADEVVGAPAEVKSRGTKDRPNKKYDEFRALHPGKLVLLPKEMTAVRGMAKAVAENERAQRMLTGQREATLLWKDGEHKVECKAKLDVWNKEAGYVVDFKTTRGAVPDQFNRSAIGGMHYDMQLAWYYNAASCASHKDLDVGVVAVEKEPPYMVRCLDIRPDWIEVGWRKCRAALELYMRCLETDNWNVLGHETFELEPPPWEVKKWLGNTPPAITERSWL